MRNLSTLLAEWLGADRAKMLAERVAGRSRMAVWQRVVHRLPELGPTEGRGYLRARAVAVVREETSRLIAQEGLSAAAFRREIEDAALQTLTEVIAAQLGQARKPTLRRRAA